MKSGIVFGMVCVRTLSPFFKQGHVGFRSFEFLCIKWFGDKKGCVFGCV